MTTTTLPKLAHLAAPHTHERVLALILQYIADLQGKRICDIPCGAGAFSAELAARGARVSAVDIEAAEPFYHDRTQRVLGDANLGLPFADAAFDVVVSIEGIEHLENPSFFLRECQRVLGPRGLLFLTTPNIDGIRSRWQFFAKGYHRYFAPKGPGRKEHGHLLPVDTVFLHGAAARAGLAVLAHTHNQPSGRTALFRLLRPLLTRKLPPELRGDAPYYGDVNIFVLQRVG